MGDLTKNFSLREFAQRDPYRPVPAEYRANVLRLARQLQPLRDELGKAITITSGYRTLRHNADAGGAPTSQHLSAKAADFVVPGVGKATIYCTILRLIPGSMEQGGLGWYGAGGHIHYDVRGFKRRWNKTSGPLPVCPKIAPSEEEDEMAVMIKGKGSTTVYVTNFIVKARVRSIKHRDFLRASGVKGPNIVDMAFVNAIQDAAASTGTLS